MKKHKSVKPGVPDKNSSLLSNQNNGPATPTLYDTADVMLANPIGFNGYLFDPNTKCYVLGNGYRFYHPELRVFYSPDSLSPFGAGGINRYQYSQLNPYNFSDPSGHAVMAIGLAVLGVLAFTATVVEWGLWGGARSNAEAFPEYAEYLDDMSIGFGIAAMVLDVTALGVGIGKAVKAGVRAGARLGGSGLTRGLGTSILPSLRKHARLGGFKRYTNQAGGSVYLSKTRTHSTRVAKAMQDASTNSGTPYIQVLSGTHGYGATPYGTVHTSYLKESKFLIEDSISARSINPKIQVIDMHHNSFTTPQMQKAALIDAAQGPGTTIFAFCHSGLNANVRAALNLPAVKHPALWVPPWPF